jgi:hypothetical protein
MHRAAINPKISVSIVFVAAMFMSIMDSTIVNVALPSLSRQFNATGTSIDAVVVGYLVSLAIIIPASGWLGDRLPLADARADVSHRSRDGLLIYVSASGLLRNHLIGGDRPCIRTLQCATTDRCLPWCGPTQLRDERRRYDAAEYEWYNSTKPYGLSCRIHCLCHARTYRGVYWADCA